MVSMVLNTPKFEKFDLNENELALLTLPRLWNILKLSCKKSEAYKIFVFQNVENIDPILLIKFLNLGKEMRFSTLTTLNKTNIKTGLDVLSKFDVKKKLGLYKSRQLFDITKNAGHYKTNSFISKIDREKIIAAKEYLDKDISKSPSLFELAKSVGLNEFKLKTGFKEVFDTTVYGYLRNERMEYAKIFLDQGNTSVSEVSSLVGYFNVSYFAGLFRKKYGIFSFCRE